MILYMAEFILELTETNLKKVSSMIEQGRVSVDTADKQNQSRAVANGNVVRWPYSVFSNRIDTVLL